MTPIGAPEPSSPAKPLRCVIYTRTAAGGAAVLEAQWATCARYLCEQPGWALVARYDDCGSSGASLERPALQRLLADIDTSWIDIVIVADIARLSRRALDLAAIGEHLRATCVTLVAVAQGLSTADSDGEAWHRWLAEFARRNRSPQGARTR